jgi:Flp pilus assembly pilin Flp
MFDLIKSAAQAAKAAAADRKGVTALEYALIAAAVTTIVVGGYKAMFGDLNTYVRSVSFS